MRKEGIAFKQQKIGARLIVRMSPDLEALADRIKALTRTITGLTLFCSPRGGKPVHYSSVKDAFKRNRDAAGVVGATLHDLRTKSLTDTDKQGNNAHKLGGQTDAKMTARYPRLRDTDIAEPPTMPKNSLYH